MDVLLGLPVSLSENLNTSSVKVDMETGKSLDRPKTN